MSVQPVSSVLCQIPLKKENFCRSELFFFLWVFFARGWSGFIIGNAAPVCNKGRLAGTVLTILSVLTVFSAPLKLACGAAFRKMQISKNRKSISKNRKSHIKKSQVEKWSQLYFNKIVNHILHKIQRQPLIWFVGVSGCRM